MKESKETETTLFEEVYDSKMVQGILNAVVKGEESLEDEPEKLRKLLQEAAPEIVDSVVNILERKVKQFETEEEIPATKTVKERHVSGYDVEKHEVETTESVSEKNGSFIIEQQKTITELQAKCSEVQAENETLKKDNRELTEENVELKNQFSSDTSHWSPSKERYPNAPTYHDGETKAHDSDETKRSPGGVTGHAGQRAVLTQEAQVDERILCFPKDWTQEQIESCNWEEGAVHSVVSARLVPTVTQYVQMQTRVPSERSKKRYKVVEGTFPREAHAVLSYGTGLRRFVAIESVVGLVSMGRISQILKNNLGITISRSSVCNILDSASENLEEASKKIAHQLKLEGEDKDTVFYLDETSIDVDGKNYWDHIVVSDDYVHHDLNASRGLKAMYASGIMKNFKGTVSSDFWRNYLNKEFDNCFCWAHLERDLAAAAKRDPESKWLQLMQQFAKDSYLAYIKAKDADSQIPAKELEKLLELYHKAIEAGWKETPKGMSKKSWALFKRFKNYEEGITAHIIDTSLPRTNNDAERPLRMLKKKLDISGVFRSEKGAKTFLAFRTVIDTANKQGINPFYALDQVLGGNTGFLVTHEADSKLETKTPQIMEVQSENPS